MPNFNDEQLKAINAEGKTIVSASAGSGKTTVMIEKMVRLILKGVPVDRVLALTYTKKAAAQMKEKLRDALIKKINEQGLSQEDRAYLKTQLNGVQTADISTVHSFCARLLRQNFYEADVSNTFGVISDSDADGKTLLSDSLSEIFATAYSTGEENFARLLTLYFKKKKDTELRQILTKIYGSIRTRADYVAFLQNCGDDSKTRFQYVLDSLVKEMHYKAAYYTTKVDEEATFFAKQKKCEASWRVIDTLYDYFAALRAEKDYYKCIGVRVKFPNAQGTNDSTPPELALHIERLRYITNFVKEEFKKYAKILSYEEEYARFADSMKTAKALAMYLLLLDETYRRKKREKDVLDYADLEHCTLNLLRKEGVCEEMRQKYDYVFVDEYQDVNPVQEELIGAIAGDNLFLVGDVKQSIYGFRGSKSQFFIDKEKEYKAAGHNALILPQNFRSAPAILEAVNTQFSAMMTLDNTSVDYKNDGAMITGGLYKDKDGMVAEGRVRVHFCGKDPVSTECTSEGIYSVKAGKKKELKKYPAETRKIIQIIKQEVKYGTYFSVGDNSYKKVNYGDIAILYRGGKESIRALTSTLAAEEIPTVGGEKINVCTYPEIKVLMDVLTLLDNERQDIPLCSALLSLGGLNADQLAEIRLWEKTSREEYNREIENREDRKKAAPFYTVCRAYAESQTDEIAYLLKKFYAFLDKFRLLAQVQSAGEVLTKLLAEKSLETQFLSRADSEDCLTRIHRFIEEASTPEPMSVRKFLDRLKSLDYEVSCPVSGGENAVKIMTMHASKGLEFPVVLLIRLSKKLHDVDDEEVVIDDEFGLVPYYRDVNTRAYYVTLLRQLYLERAGKEQIKDELNVYYVAATRAKYAMHLLYKDKEPSQFVNTAFGDNYQEFTDFSLWDKFIYADEPMEMPYPAGNAFVQHPKEELVAAIEQSLLSRYSHGGLENYPVKDSATGLMKRMDDPFAPKTEQKSGYFQSDEGDLMDGDKKERGLAYHAFLEHFDFDKIGKEDLQDAVESALETFRLEKRFDESYFKYLQTEKLCEILSAPVFASLKGCKLYKERAFLVGLPVKDVLRIQGKADVVKDDEAEVLFQGAIDLLAIGEKKTYVVDYKYSTGDAKYLKTHYAPQLALYKKAVSKITGRAEEDIATVIVNIAQGFAVEL